MHSRMRFVVFALVAFAFSAFAQNEEKVRAFEQFANKRSERWFRVFNESAVLLFTAIVVLVVVKPF